MENVIQAVAYTLGDNIDTDQIYPGRYLTETDPARIAAHCLEDADASLRARFVPGSILVAGSNFGCGSSREHAAIALKAMGVSLVIAESFARIFYRNAINLALPLLVCPGLGASIQEGDKLTVCLDTGEIRNKRTHTSLFAEPIGEHALHLLSCGGVKAMMQKKTGL